MPSEANSKFKNMKINSGYRDEIKQWYFLDYDGNHWSGWMIFL